MFCFTVLQIYFLLVVYSLYRELNGTAPNTSYDEPFWYVYKYVYIFALINIRIGTEWLRTNTGPDSGTGYKE